MPRPKYFSDGDTRPTYRGSLYGFIRRTGLAWAALLGYGTFAVWSYLRGGSPRDARLLACRACHVGAMYLNTVLSDGLHNLDRRLGAAYDAPSTLEVEQRLHANDWRAALCVPASYHLLLVCGIMAPHRVALADAALLGANVALFGLMCVRISPERITPRRELFLSFVLTFGGQMALLLAAMWREAPHHPWWLALWGVYAIGLLLKALEWPDSAVFGHHEVLHATTIAGNGLGLLVDALTT